MTPWALWNELRRREPTLALLALVMALAMLPALVALGLDERELRGVNVWVKPLKFMASLSLFAASTAWFMGLLDAGRRRAAPARFIVWTIVLAASAEVTYISLQSALGQASHYNVADTLHKVMYQLMGLGAVMLMVTQPVLAWQIARHGRPEEDATWRQAVVLALLMTFVLGVGAAAPLASAQPPSGAGLPVLGWHLGGGDLRPAHFVGSHAQQFVPFVAWLLLRGAVPQARLGLWAFAAAYLLLWLWALRTGLNGAVWLPPPV